jgi:hypothetical protein
MLLMFFLKPPYSTMFLCSILLCTNLLHVSASISGHLQKTLVDTRATGCKTQQLNIYADNHSLPFRSPLKKIWVYGLYLCSYSVSFGAVGLAAGYGMDDWTVGFRIQVRSRIFISSGSSNRVRDHPTSHPLGTGNVAQEVKRQKREADH